MALQYLLAPTFQFINTAGKPLSGGAYMEVYVHGTRTKYFCASDFDGTLHPFRIPLDSLGSNIVLADDTGSYDVYAYNRYGTLMMSRYNVKPGAGGGIGGTITSTDGSIDIHPTNYGVDLSVPEQQQSDWNEFRTDRPSYIRNKPNLLLKADRVSGATPGNFAGLDVNGNLTDSGKKASDFKTKQAAVSDPTASGNTISFIDTISQDTNGVIAPTKKTVSLSSAVDSEAEDAAATPKAVKLAYEHADSVVSDLDAEVTSTDGTNVQVKVTETDGKISAVNVTTDNTENKNNKVSSWQTTPDNTHYPSEKLVKDGLDAKADLTNSVAIFDGYMRRMNEGSGWRRLAYKQFNNTNTNINALFRLYLIGSNNDHIGVGDLFVNIRFNSSGSAPALNTCYLMSHRPLNTSIKLKVVGVAGNAVVEVWFRPPTFSLLMLSCLGNGYDVSANTKDWTFEKYIDATDPEPVEDTANNIYVLSGTVKRVQLDIDNPTSGNLVAMDENGLVKDSGISITSSDVANWNSKMDRQSVGNASEPVYLENGIAKVATNLATTGNLDKKLNVDGSNATTVGVTTMMRQVESGSADLTKDSYYFGDSNSDHTQIVRRPILNIWNFFAPKVDKKIADRLGSVGSADKPIYLENGVPKVCTDGIPYSEVSYGGKDGYGVFVGGAHNLANSSRCYCTFLISVSSYPDNIAHTYIGTFTFRGGVLNSELKCLTGTPAYPLRIATIYTEDGKDSNGNPTYTVGLYVIPDDKTYKYSGYKLTRIASTNDFIWDVKAISSAAYDECNSVAKPSLRPIILTWDAGGGNVNTTGGTWIPTFDKATIIDCRGIVDMSIQVDLSIIGQRTYVGTIASYDITLVNSSKTDILPVSLHQTGRMPRQAYSSSSTIDGTIDISHTHRFIFPITSATNLLAGYMPKITLPSNYPLDSGAQVNIKALCRGIILPYGADEPF